MFWRKKKQTKVVPAHLLREKTGLRLCQFNVLSPAALLKSPLDRVPWRPRHDAICDFLLADLPDVVCLQDYTFDKGTVEEGFQDLYEERLGDEYEFYCLRRTGEQIDGLATLVRKSVFATARTMSHQLELDPKFCERVAQVLELDHLGAGRRVVIANVSLTLPDPSNSHDIPVCRPGQINQVLDKLWGVATADSVVFVCGDMASDHLMESPPLPSTYSAEEINKPLATVFDNGLRSALHDRHPNTRPISRTSLDCPDGCTDYVFYRPDRHLELLNSGFYPPYIPVNTLWHFESGWLPIEDGRPLLLSTLSDHRPLIVDFRITPPRILCALAAGIGAAVGGLLGIAALVTATTSK